MEQVYRPKMTVKVMKKSNIFIILNFNLAWLSNINDHQGLIL
jgi:hypothetical protein